MPAAPWQFLPPMCVQLVPRLSMNSIRREFLRRTSLGVDVGLALPNLFMKSDLLNSLLTVSSTMAVFGWVRAADKTFRDPLKLALPLHTLKGTPENLPAGPNIEPVSDVAPPPIQVPKGV